MPRGWKQVSIRNEHYAKLEARAKENRRSVAGELELILAEAGLINLQKAEALARR
ncbi:MAG: hypothetical protein JRN62_06010 [Nitrososphaerota archaeon]|nr:hypothetical protein [Nitrososphaerota archaeon]